MGCKVTTNERNTKIKGIFFLEFPNVVFTYVKLLIFSEYVK